MIFRCVDWTARGDAEIGLPPEQVPDHAQIMRLVVFATEAIADGDAIANLGREIQQSALLLFHEASSAERDPDGWTRSHRAVRHWHRERSEVA